MAAAKRRLPLQLQRLPAEHLQKVQSHVQGLLAVGLQEIPDLNALDEIIAATLAADREHDLSRRDFSTGQTVRIEGLTGAKELNGQTARIASKDAPSGRYVVEFSDGSAKKLKAENIVAIANTPPPRRSTPSTAASTTAASSADKPVRPSAASSADKPVRPPKNLMPKDAKFAIGDRVRVGGLNGALELNGQLAVIFGFDKASGRYIVEFENGAGQKKLLEKNLTGQGVANGPLAAKARMFAQMA